MTKEQFEDLTGENPIDLFGPEWQEVLENEELADEIIQERINQFDQRLAFPSAPLKSGSRDEKLKQRSEILTKTKKQKNDKK